MYNKGKDPSTILEEENLSGGAQGDELQKIIDSAIAENPDAIANYKKGKENAIMFLVGQVMKKAKGKTDPNTAKKLLKKSIT